MADSIEVDLAQARALARDLAAAGSDSRQRLRGVMSRAGVKMKVQMRTEATTSRRLRRVPFSITYDLSGYRDGLQVEVGPDVSKDAQQGPLAWIGYDGTSRRGPIYAEPQGLLDDEAEVVAQQISLFLDEALT